MRLTLYRFRYRATPDGRWVTARYRTSESEIAHRHPLYELLDVEVREVSDDPYANSMARLGGAFRPEAQVRSPNNDAPLELSPRLDARERMLVGVMLRRYVTWCARRRRYAQMQGAANLHRRVRMGI